MRFALGLPPRRGAAFGRAARCRGRDGARRGFAVLCLRRSPEIGAAMTGRQPKRRLCRDPRASQTGLHACKPAPRIEIKDFFLESCFDTLHSFRSMSSEMAERPRRQVPGATFRARRVRDADRSERIGPGGTGAERRRARFVPRQAGPWVQPGAMCGASIAPASRGAAIALSGDRQPIRRAADARFRRRRRTPRHRRGRGRGAARRRHGRGRGDRRGAGLHGRRAGAGRTARRRLSDGARAGRRGSGARLLRRDAKAPPPRGRARLSRHRGAVRHGDPGIPHRRRVDRDAGRRRRLRRGACPLWPHADDRARPPRHRSRRARACP